MREPGNIFRTAVDGIVGFCSAMRPEKSAKTPVSGFINAVQLEDRVLYSAVPLSADFIEPTELQDANLSAEVPEAYEAFIPPEPLIDADDASDPFLLPESLAFPLAPADLELIFINGNVEDYQSLIDDAASAVGSGSVQEIIVLDAQQNGILQISQKLKQYQDVSAIHLVSHGSDGQVQLGNTWLDNDNIEQFENELNGWSQSLRSGTDLLIYGCDLASNEAGQSLVNSLSLMTQADVAASIDDTGHTKYGGDWDLEYVVGTIETQIAFSAAVQQDWVGKMAIITVDTTNDVVDGNTTSVALLQANKGADGFISLREAILAVNAGAGGDTIQLLAGTYTFTPGAASEDAAATGDLDITKDVTIIGAGAATTIIDAADIDRVFDVHSGTVSIQDLTMLDGDATTGDGGGIRVNSGVTADLISVDIRSSLGNSGGGIFSVGVLSLTDVTVDGNTATWGGGINIDGGSATLDRVTISNNTSSNNGGGMYNFGAASLTNVTISGNSSTSGSGGGLWTNQAITATNVTIAHNSASFGGAGIQAQGAGNVTLTNSILHNPLGANASKSLISGGNNIDSDGTAGLGDPLDSIDPMLGALQDNGGSTFTHALMLSSVAIDPGAVAGAPAVDQRGYTRDASPDIGAYEFAGAAVAANGAPVAVDDAYNVDQDTTLSVDAITGVLFNDTDGDGDTLTANVVSGPSDGVLGLAPLGVVNDTNLTGHAAADQQPVFSPDGSQIAFKSDRTGFTELFTMNVDGTNVTQLTFDSAIAGSASWSPDGLKLTYFTDRDGNNEIYSINADGTGQTRLTTNVFDDAQPNWSPDGTKILFRSDRDGNNEIYVMDADGTNQTRLTADAGRDNNPAWSPDGSQITFTSNRNGNFDVYTMNADGTGLFQVTSDAGNDRGPRFSPDGSRIVFQSNRDGDNELFVIDADGTNEIQLTNNIFDDSSQAWSPDGTKLAFDTNRDGNSEIYVVDLTFDGSFDYVPNAGFTGVDTFTYVANDGTTDSNVATVTITVNGKGAAPTDIAPNSFSINENVNTSSGTSLGKLTATDPDVSDSFTYSIVGGTDQAKFTIGGGSSNELILTDGVLDFETKPSYSVTVRVTDSALNTYDETLTVNVNDLTDVLIVDTTSDVSDGTTTSIAALLADKGADGFISLREAIAAANADTNGAVLDEIHFAIGSGVQTIQLANLLGALPTITEAVVIDGTTQVGFAGTPLIELDGSLLAGTPSGLTIQSGGSTIRGLVINQFGGSGIVITTGGGNLIEGNYIGTDVTGSVDLGNNVDGIRIVNSAGNTIGGTTTATRNVIAGNNDENIEITGALSTGNKILGNYLGVNADGNAAIDSGGASAGIRIESGASSNTIGGTSTPERNIISGNIDGVLIVDASSTGNVISGNYIGTDEAGTSAVANTNNGVAISNAANNIIGGTTTGERNVISGNNGSGINLSGNNATGTQILGNYIGTDATGASGLGNNDGIGFGAGADINVVGGVLAGEANVIAFNARNGIRVASSSVQNTFRGNSIHSNLDMGIDLSGNNVSPNDVLDTDNGGNSQVNFPALATAVIIGSDVTISGTYSGAASGTFQLDFYVSTVLDGSGYGEGETYIGSDSVVTDGSGNGTFSKLFNFVLAPGSFISATATDASGNTSEFGVTIAATPVEVMVVDTANDILDGNTASLSTLLANKGADGFISLREAIEAANNTLGVQGIEFNISGGGPHTIVVTAALPTITEAVVIDGFTQTGASANTLAVGNDAVMQIVINGASAPNGTDGLTITGGGSTISGLVINGFRGMGIVISGDGGNIISGNFIGTDVTGTVDVGNSGHGVHVESSNHVIGGIDPADRNLISGNNGTAVHLDGLGILNNTQNNVVQGNYIGTTTDGMTDLGNSGNGILVSNKATGNLIGGAATGASNLIAASSQSGVKLVNFGTTLNVVQGNLIGVDATGASSLAMSNGGGISINGSAAQNIIGGTAAGEGNTITSVSGTSHGIELTGGGTENLISGNSIFDVGGDGIFIELASGSNNEYIPAILTSAVTSGASLTVTGVFTEATLAGQNVIVEFFSSPGTVSDEGKVFLGSDTILADGTGLVTINSSILAPVAIGDSITVTVRDAATNTTVFSNSVQAISGANSEQVLSTNDPLVLNEGATATITTLLLETTDAEQTSVQLVYTVTGVPGNGTLRFFGSPLAVSHTFTQDDIDNNRIAYTHDGSENFTDNFTFNVDDGSGTITSDTFNITITPVNDNTPVADSESFTVLEGGMATESDLDAGTSLLDGDTDIDLPNDTLSVNTTPVVDVSFGSLILNADGTFSYTHDGSENFTDSFTYQVTDAIGNTDTATVTITITPVNDNTPVADPESITVLEGGTATQADLDVGTSLLDGDTDIDLPNDTLTVNTTPVVDVSFGLLILNSDGTFSYTHDGSENFSDSFTYEVSDAAGITDTATVTITITPVNDNSPTAITPNAFNVDENTNTSSGFSFGALSAADADAGETFTYNIQGGTDQARFTIAGAGGDELVLTDGTLDFETQSSYHVIVRVTDSFGHQYDEAITVSVNNLTESATLWIGEEGSTGFQQFGDPGLLFDPAGGTGGTFSPIFDLADFGADAKLSAIHYVGSDITIGQTTTFDLLAGDLVLTQEKAVTLSSINTLAVEAGDVFVFRPDVAGNYTAGRFYMLLDNLGQGDEIHAITLVEKDTMVGGTMFTEGSFLYTAKSVDSRIIESFAADDLSLSTVSGTTTLVLDGNAPDVNFNHDIFGLDLFETTTTVGGVVFNAGELLVSLKSDDSFVGTTGNSADTDKEDIFRLNVISSTSAQAELIFDGSDVGLNQSTKGLTLVLTATNWTPTDINVSNSAVDENVDTSAGFSVGLLTAADANPAEAFSYAIVPGGDGANFTIGGVGGDELILAAGVLDYETKSSYTVTVRVTDSGGNTYDEALTISVNDLNEAPTAIAPGSFNVDENTDTSSGLSLGTLSTTDEDASESFAYSIAGGLDAGRFTIGGVGGNELILTDGILNFEVKSSYNVIVRVTDSGGNTFDAPVTVTVNDLNDVPTAISPASFNVDENMDTASGHSLGALSVTDEDTLDTFSYTIQGGADAGSFSMGGVGSDELILTDGTLDFETRSSYSVIVRVTDGGGNTFDESITVKVNDLNESPTAIAPTSFNVNENVDTSSGLFLGILNTTDEDSSETFTYTIQGGADAGKFSIGGASLDELILTDGTLDFESKPTYSVIVRVTDSGGNQFDETMTVNVNDQNDAPTIDLVPTVKGLAENVDTTSSVKVADVLISDDAIAGTLTLAIGGVDGSRFEIVAGNELHLKAGETLDFETQSTFDVSVSVDDLSVGTTPDDVDSWLMPVIDVNETPIAVDEVFETYTNTELKEISGILSNDSDPEGVPLSFVVLVDPTDGLLLLNSDGSFTYVPKIGFSGTDSFVYQVSDGVTTGQTATARISVKLIAPPAVPSSPEPHVPESREASAPVESDSDEEAELEFTPGIGPAALNANGPGDLSGVDAVTPSFESFEVLVQTASQISEDRSNSSALSSLYVFAQRSDKSDKMDSSSMASMVLQAPYSLAHAALSSFDALREELAGDDVVAQAIIGSTMFATASMSVGYVIWLVRGGVLLSSVLSSMPAWQMIDPLPVLGYFDEDDDGHADESLENLVDKSNVAHEKTQEAKSV